jgi:hypothetical protein
MPDAEWTTKRLQQRLGRFLVVTAALVCLVLATVWLGLALYLTTPLAARQASQLLSDVLNSPVRVTGLRFSGGALSARGLSLASPPDFAVQDLATVKSIKIRPSWLAILSGKKDVDEIVVEDLRVSLGKNGKGEWNFRDLARSFSAKKGSGGGEIFVRRLTVTDASLAVDGVIIDHLSLTMTDLSTKGSTDTRLLLACRDAGGTRFRLEGSTRLGPDPSLDVSLTAPEIALNNYRRSAAGLRGLDVSRGIGSLSVGINFRNGKASAAGRISCDRVALGLGKGVLPLKADLDFTGKYDNSRDEASLEASSLTINETVGLHASGTISQVRTVRKFAAKVSLDRTDLERLTMLLPSAVRGGLVLTGDLHPADFIIAGDAAHGITGGKGTLQLSGGEVAKGEEFLARKLSAVIALVGGTSGWAASGRISQGEASGGELLQSLDARFSAHLTSRLNIVRADLSSFNARLAGIPVTGRIGYLPGAAEPFTAGVAVGAAPVAAANRFLAKQKATFSAGTLTLDIQASGKGPREFTGKLKGELDGCTGDLDGKQVAINEAALDAGFGVTEGKPSVAGKMHWRGSIAGSGPVVLTSVFSIAGNRFSLSAGSVDSGRTHIDFAGIHGALPVPVQEGGGRRIPLRMQLDGVSARSGDAAVSGLSGTIGVDYRSGQGGQRLSGGGQFAVSDFAFKGKRAGSLEGRLDCTETGVITQVNGRVLGGRLNGMAAVDPFAPRKKSSFRFHLDGLKGPEFTPFVPAGLPVKISGGTLDAELEGEYAAGEGISCRVATTAAGISLAGDGGQPLLSDGRLRSVVEVKDDTFFIREGEISPGDGVAITFQGEVAHISSPSRLGSISLVLPITPFGTLLHTFAAQLPENYRTVAVEGTLGWKGNVRLAAGNAILDGELSLEKAGIGGPDQQMAVVDATGTIPVSLVLAGDAGGTKQVRLSYRKENFANLLAALRQAAQKGASLTIGKVRFGPLEWRETSLVMRAENGLTEITALKSTLFEGALLGAGYVNSGKKLRYGLDMTIDDLSLRALCDAYPNIKGYISGKVDGIISLYGEGKGLSSLRGFTDIWTRSGPDEKMLVSKDFLQKLAGRKLQGLFFRNDRPYDRGEIRGYLEGGYLTFEVLDIAHTNMFGIKDLSVSVAPVQNKISLVHLITSIKAAATRGKAAAGGEEAAPAPAATDFKWQE